MRDIMLILITGVFIALFLFRYMEAKRKDRAAARHEDRKQKFEELMITLQKVNSEQNVQESDTTAAE